MMAEQFQLIIGSFRSWLIDDGVLNEEEYEEVRAELSKTMSAEPPLEGTWKYRTHLARKVRRG